MPERLQMTCAHYVGGHRREHETASLMRESGQTMHDSESAATNHVSIARTVAHWSFLPTREVTRASRLCSMKAPAWSKLRRVGWPVLHPMGQAGRRIIPTVST